MKFVTAENPVTTKHPKLGEISITVEVPQVESVEEAVKFCGGDDGFLEYFNNAIETSAKNGGRAALRNLPENANLDEARPKIQSIVKEYAPSSSGERKVSAKKTLDSVRSLVESGQEFTREQLLELLMKAK